MEGIKRGRSGGQGIRCYVDIKTKDLWVWQQMHGFHTGHEKYNR